MPVNGFIAGKRVWVQVVLGSVRADFVGVIAHVTEMPGENYHVEFRGGFSVSFTQGDLDLGRVTCLDHDMEQHGEFHRRKTDGDASRK